MFAHHEESARRLKDFFAGREGVVAVIWGGSCVKGNARPDSDIDAIIVVTEEAYARLASSGRTAEVITGHCTYEGGYFDVKYKTKETVRDVAVRGSEPARNAFVGARVLWTSDGEIPALVKAAAAYPEREAEEKLACFNADLQLNYGYFLKVVPAENVYMRVHLAREIVYSVYRLILLENRTLFPCNRRLEEAVLSCKKRPADIVERGHALLGNITEETCRAFVEAFRAQTELPLVDDVSLNCARYVRFYEEWWRQGGAPLPDEW